MTNIVGHFADTKINPCKPQHNKSMETRIEPANFWRDMVTEDDTFPPGFSFKMWSEMLERLYSEGVELYDAALGYLHITLYFFNDQQTLRRVSVGFGDNFVDRITQAIAIIKSEQNKSLQTTT